MFHLIVGLFLIGLIVMWMVASPAFRNFVIIVVLLIGGGIWWLIDSSSKSTEKSRNERAAQEYAATVAIRPADLKLENVKLANASYGPSEFILDGSVTNNSAFRLGEMNFEVTLTDCENDDCRIVGQAAATASVTVPSGQLRAFSSYAIRFNNLPPEKGKRAWTYKITRLRTA